MPKDNSIAFVYLISFFKEMLNYSDKNKLTPEKVSELVCETMIGEDKLALINSNKSLGENLVRAASKSTV